MEILWLLIPMSALLVLLILAVFGWALWRGQFDDLEHEGQRILQHDVDRVDASQVPAMGIPEESLQHPTDHSRI